MYLMTTNSKELAVIPAASLKVGGEPVTAYLASLGSSLSRRNMGYSLDLIARLIAEILGGENANRYTVNWSALRSSHVQAIRSKLQEKGYAPASANRHLAALKGVLKECWRLELMSGDDFTRAVNVKPVKGERIPKGRALAYRELKALFQAAADGTAAGVRNAAILAVLYGAGLRRSEVTALSIADWNPADLSLKVKGKGNKERLVHLNNGSLNAMQEWLSVRGSTEGSAPLFVPVNKSDRLQERRFTSQAINIALRTLAQKAGIDTFTPHDLRRSFIGDLVDAGADLVTVQKMAGHASIQTTARYDRRGESAKRAASALLKVPFVPRTP